MSTALIILLLLIIVACIDVFILSSRFNKPKAIKYVWIGLFVFSLISYFRSEYFDFALLLVFATGISGIVALLDQLFLRKQRIADVEAATDNTDSVGQAITDNGLPLSYREPLIIEYSRSFFPVLLLVLVLRSFVFEPFRIPSGSMYPTLEVGDFIVVNKFSYGLHLPVTNTKILAIDKPQRGDVLVFKYPKNPRVNYIKRVVGLPGDKVVYRNKVLYINEQRQNVDYQDLFSYRESGRTSTVKRYTEALGNKQVDILMNDQAPMRNGEWLVPEGHYFVMGDNRDASSDSRYWGFLSEQNLVGKAKFIWLHLDIGGNGFDFSRIGTAIN